MIQLAINLLTAAKRKGTTMACTYKLNSTGTVYSVSDFDDYLKSLPHETLAKFSPVVAALLGDKGTKFSKSFADVKKQISSFGVKLLASESSDSITINNITVPTENRNSGVGTKAMKIILDYADSAGKKVLLTPSSDFGGNKARLISFYKRLGFIENKGANKDYAISETMYREPSKGIKFSKTKAAPNGDNIIDYQGQFDILARNEYPLDLSDGAIVFHKTPDDVSANDILNNGYKKDKANSVRKNGISFFYERKAAERYKGYGNGKTIYSILPAGINLLNKEVDNSLSDYYEKNGFDKKEPDIVLELGYDGIIDKANGGTEIAIYNQNVLNKIKTTLDANEANKLFIENSENVTKFSKSHQQTTSSTVAQVKSWLPKRVQGMLDSGKLRVVQSVNDLPAHLREAGKSQQDKLASAFSASSASASIEDASSLVSGNSKFLSNNGKTKTRIKHLNHFLDRVVSFYSGSIPPSSDKGGSDSWSRNSAKLSNITHSNAFIKHGFSGLDIETRRMVLQIVRLSINDNEIGNSIIQSIPVDVMNLLGSEKFASKMVLHNKTMLKDVDTVNSESSVPVLINNAITKLISSLAGITTEQVSRNGKFDSMGFSFKRNSTGGIIDDRHDVTPNSNVMLGDDAVEAALSPSIISQLKGVEALYSVKDNIIYLVADNLNQKNILPVISHELFHSFYATDPKAKAVMSKMMFGVRESFDQASRGKGTKTELSSYQRVINAKTPEKDQIEEYLAYQISSFLENPKNTSPTLGNLIKDWIASIRVALLRYGMDMGFVRSLTPRDLVALSQYGAKVDAIANPIGNSVLMKASKAGYEGSDTGEAFEWLRAVSKGLDMSQEARMARAKAMGFDVDKIWYHGSKSDFNEFDKNKINEDFNLFGKGFYFASMYNHASEHGKVKNFLLKANNSAKYTLTLQKEADDMGINISDYVKLKGFDSIIQGDKFNAQIVIFDANQIRSEYAAFDPDFADSPNLLASKAKFSVAPRRLTDAWIDWWNNSMFAKTDKETGRREPIKFYHATNAPDLTFFDKEKLGSNTATHATSGLGFFFSPLKTDVQQYGSNVVEVYLSANKVYSVNSYDLPMFDSLEEAKQFSKSLQKKGYDAIWIKDAKYAIVFESNQAKLTSNDEPTQSPDIRYSFAGENAKTADKYQLATAKERLANGDDKEAVRRDTGWFKGVDGKWRFEIDDSNASLNVEGFKQSEFNGVFEARLIDVLNHPALFAAYPELKSVSIANSLNYKEEGFWSKATKHISLSKKLADLINNINGIETEDDKFNKKRLDNLYRIDVIEQGKELYNYSLANPDDKDYLYNSIDDAIKEATQFKEDEIKKLIKIMNMDRSSEIKKIEDDIKSTVIHEIQHAIQSQEGFASGGSPEQFNYTQAQKDEFTRIEDALVVKRMGRGDSVAEGVKRFTEMEGRPPIIGAAGLADRTDVKKLAEMYRQVKTKLGKPEDNNHVKYEKLAGEIESRNVQARLGLTAEQRRNTPIADTQDIPDSEAIVVWNGTEMASMSPPANTDNGVRFSVASSIETGLPEETNAEKFQRKAQDKFNRFKVIQEHKEIELAKDNGYTGNNIFDARQFMKDNGIKNVIRDETNVYQAESINAGISTEKVKDFEENVMKPLVKEAAQAKIKMADISDFLLMRYTLTKPELGISTAEANNALHHYRHRADFAKLESIANKWERQTAIAQQEMTNAGMMPSSDLLPIEIPKQRSGESDVDYNRRLVAEVKSQDMVTNIIHDYEKSINAIEKNKIAVTAANFIKEANDQSIGVLNPTSEPSDGKFTYYVGGVKHTAQFNDELLARAFKERGIEQLGAVLNMTRDFNNFLSRAYTAYSPTFLIKNPIRDAIQGMITNTSKFGMGVASDVFKAYPHAAKELYKHFRNHGSSAEVDRYRKAGGSTGAAYLSDAERLGSEIMDAYNEYAGAVDTYNRTYLAEINAGSSPKVAALKASFKAAKAGLNETPVIGYFMRFMENANSITENALRLATFTTLVNSGYSDAKAAAAAKDLMNFNRKGELGSQVGSLYLFFNPSAQGTQVLFAALKSNELKKQALALAGMIALSAFLIAETMRGGDDDDEEKWKMLPDNLKDRNFIFGSGDTKIMLPVPYGYGVFHSFGNAISDVMHGASTYKASIRMAAAMFDNFSPFGNPIDSTHDAFQLLPTIPKMMMSPSVNENNFGSPIQPDKWSNAKPDSENMYRNTKGSIYATVARGLNELTGGSKYEQGKVSISPETLKFWTTTLTGGTGTFFADTFNLGSITAQGVTPSLKDVPIAKAFAHELSVQDARQAFWKNLKEAQLVTDEFSLAKKAHDRPAMMAIKNNHSDLIALAKVGNRYQKMAASTRDQIDRIRLDDSLTLEEKRNRQKLLERKEMAIYEKFLAIFDKRTG